MQFSRRNAGKGIDTSFLLSMVNQVFKKEKGRPKIVVIVGPNASGKSDLAVEIAKRIGGEIISADSRQIYRGMDIGTGKVTKKEMAGIPHYLLDVALPKKDFNVSHFKRLAEKKIEEIIERGHVPVIVGGTGFWIDALIYDFNLPEIRPNKKLRAELEKQSVEKLFGQLKKLDSERARTIEPKNKRRLIRALEIVLSSKKPVPKLEKNSKYNVLFLGVKKDKKELESRIYRRLLKRLDRGMIEEIKKLRKSGVSWKRLDDLGLEYRFISRYLRGQLTYDEMVAQLFSAIKNYAKRQMTWFRKNPRTHWIGERKQAIKLARAFIFQE